MRNLFVFFFTFSLSSGFSQEINYVITNRAAVYETMLTTRESAAKNLENEISLKRFYNSLLVCEDAERNDTCKLYTSHEKIFMAYLTGDFSGILERIKNGNDLHQNSRYAKCHYENSCPCANEYLYDSLFIRSASLISRKQNQIKNKIEADKTLSPDEKKLLTLHLNSATAYNNIAMFDAESMKSQTDTFLAHSSDDFYRDYAQNYLHPKYKTGSFGFGVNFSLGYNVYLGGTSYYFRNLVVQQLNAEISIKRIYVKADFLFSSGKKLKQGFTYNQIDFTTDSLAFMMGSQVFAGYTVLDNDKFKLTPIVGYGNAAISLSGNTRNMIFTGSYAAGMDFDYKFYHYRFYNDYSNLFSNPYNKTCWYLRARISWQNLVNDDTKFSGSDLFIGAGIGFFINGSKKI